MIQGKPFATVRWIASLLGSLLVTIVSLFGGPISTEAGPKCVGRLAIRIFFRSCSQLVGVPAKATKGMTSQSLVHLFIITSVMAGNVIYFRQRRRKGTKES